MNEQELRNAVVGALRDTVPDRDVDALAPDVSYGEALGMDSMDFLDLVQRIHDATGVDIPERDYVSVDTLDTMVAYLKAHA